MKADEELLAVFRAEVEAQLEKLHGVLQSPHEQWDAKLLCRVVHNVKGAARMVEVDLVQDAAHVLEDVLIVLRDGELERTETMASLIRDGVRLLEKSFEAREGESFGLEEFRILVDDLLAPPEEFAAPLGSGDGEEEAPSKAKSRKPDEARSERDEGLSAAGVESSKESGTEAEANGAQDGTRLVADTVRISVEKLDRLTGIATEVALATNVARERDALVANLQALLQGLRARFPEFAGSEEYLASMKLSKELRRSLIQDEAHSEQSSIRLEEAIRGIRMVRIDTLRAALNRVVRDACASTGKQAVLRVDGGSTELDRAVLDGLRDPIVHLVRNSVGHGIETPEERVAIGKSPEGQIALAARAVGSQVEIVVRDDGRGMDVRRIAAKAVELGLLQPEEVETMESEEILDLIFQSGFSTAEQLNELSGRGVGLDVVRSNLDGIGGRVSIETDESRGTTFFLRVPLTRLTTHGIVVRIGKHYFASPLESVAGSVFVHRDDLKAVDKGFVTEVDGKPVPVVALESILGIESTASEKRPAILLAEGSRRCLFLVDEVVGRREFALQPLSWNLGEVAGVTASAVLDDGRLLMILGSRELLLAGARARGSMGITRQVQDKRARRILVVDDSVTSRTLERTILGAAGYEVLLAVDGEEAWELLQQEGAVDLLISDVEMPRLDGFQLAERVRGDPDLEGMPIVLVTSLGSEEHIQRGAQVGADAHVVKGSFDQDELLSVVARLM